MNRNFILVLVALFLCAPLVNAATNVTSCMNISASGSYALNASITGASVASGSDALVSLA